MVRFTFLAPSDFNSLVRSQVCPQHAAQLLNSGPAASTRLVLWWKLAFIMRILDLVTQYLERYKKFNPRTCSVSPPPLIPEWKPSHVPKASRLWEKSRFWITRGERPLPLDDEVPRVCRAYSYPPWSSWSPVFKPSLPLNGLGQTELLYAWFHQKRLRLSFTTTSNEWLSTKGPRKLEFLILPLSYPLTPWTFEIRLFPSRYESYLVVVRRLNSGISQTNQKLSMKNLMLVLVVLNPICKL